MDGAERFRHLRALTDDRGIFEHALLDTPRREHGYCVDDVARALIVVTREPDHDAELQRLGAIYLGFLEAAIGEDGLTHNRMDEHGAWTDEPSMGDWWGRLLWGLGTAAAQAPDASTRARALRAFHRAARQDAQDLRTIAFAALGASEVISRHPDDARARHLLRELIDAIPPSTDANWPWPEPRLRYANASIAEALIAAGGRLGDDEAVCRGLTLLEFLLTVETRADRLSVTGSDGRDPGCIRPLFDQQPIEVAAIADASARAFEQTGEDRWLIGITLSWQWFRGRNDSHTPMVDERTGAGFDGLERDGRNENRGAESTLAAISAHQQARRVGALADA